ncbi:MAG TPA: TonB-dependent receptor, partial [Rhizomicrobium sp.]|nr:TonB-dependent receptor [Rhizomicrobium sp.]
MLRHSLLATTVLGLAVSPAFADNTNSKGHVETVVVTASPIAEKPDRFATIVTQIDRSDILKKGGDSLTDALKDVPGVAGTEFAPGASRPVIRGFDANRVRILEDGVGSFDVSDIGPDHGVPIDPLAAQRIEVVRGAATLRYGSQAIGGVVNVINDRVPTILPDNAFSGDATVGYDSNANTRETSVLMDGAVGNFALHADGFFRQADNYHTPLGVQANSAFKGDGMSLGGSYFFTPDTHTGLAVMHYDAKYGIPSDDTHIDMGQTKVLSRTSIDIDNGAFQTLNIDAGYAGYRHAEIDPAGVVGDTFLDHEWDSRAEAIFGPLSFLSASSLGVQYQDRRFSGTGEAIDYLDPTHTKTAAGFAFGEAQLAPFATMQFGARLENVDISGTPASGLFTRRSYTPVSGSAGILFDVSDAWKIGVTASSAARAPAQTELFAHGPHDGPDTFETGDPTLKEERANSLEGSLRYKVGDTRFEGSLWGTRFDNYIYGDLTGRTCDDTGTCMVGPGLDLLELLYKQRGAVFWGAEGKGDVGLYDNETGVLSLDLLADLVRADFTNGGGPVPRIAPWRVGSGLSWGSDAFDAGFLVSYVGARTDTAAFETPTAGYTNVDAQIAWRPFEDKPNLEFAVVGHNLTDT